MAGLTTTKSPLHEKVCVAGTAIVGGAVGSAVPVVGTLAGAATGFIVGMLVCSRDVISKPIGDKLDFSSAINEIARNAGLQNKLIDAMVEQEIAPDRQSGAIMLSYVLDEAKKNPDKYYRSSSSAFMPPTGKAAHGLHDLARKSRGAAATAAS